MQGIEVYDKAFAHYVLDDPRRAPPQTPPAENTAEKQRVRQQMLARNWHDDAISSELGSFCQKSHLIAGLSSLRRSLGLASNT
jgi:hypothetical protein